MRHRDNASNPARGLAAVVCSDSAKLDKPPKALLIGILGHAHLSAVGVQSPVVIKKIGDGQLLSIRLQQVCATGTTASHIVESL